MDSIRKLTIQHWKLLWQIWDIRGVILISLFLQTLLIFFAPFRKRKSSIYITIPMWLAYLLADITANFALGLITRSQWSTSGPSSNPDLLAFWAPFLLVHLGGPDTITAFALEDNELWLRHLLGLGFQCWAVAYAFYKSFPNKKLWLPTMLMFIAGLIKYTERTWSLYLASPSKFRDSLLPKPDPGPDYPSLAAAYHASTTAGFPTLVDTTSESNQVDITESKRDKQTLTDLEVVQHAYSFFETFKGLIADLIFSFRERSDSRDFFLKRTARDAFKVVEVELSFFYETLYTKAVVVQTKFGYFLRFVSIVLNFAALVVFHFMKKHEIQKIDIGITYTLLAGAVTLDTIALVLVLYSDWTTLILTKSDSPSCFLNFFIYILRVKRDRRSEKQWRIMQMLCRRWSESISQYNLIHYCLHPRSKWWEKVVDFCGLTNMLDGLKYVEQLDFPNELRDLIFTELEMKSEKANTLEKAKEVYSVRGDQVLQSENCTYLLPWINEVDFDESLLLWHIATELCLNKDKVSSGTKTEGGNARNSGNAAERKDSRDLCKLLSDYMMYLLIMQSALMSTVVGIGQIRFRDTCAEAKKFFQQKKIGKAEEKNKCCLNIFATNKCFCGSKLEQGQQHSQASPKAPSAKECLGREQQGEEMTHSCMNNIFCCFMKCCCEGETKQDKVHIEACQSILAVNTVVKPVIVKGDRSKSALFDACRLAKKLEELGDERKWKIMSKVWVELLSYSACHCRAIDHAAQLSKGGQLITLVWLLMANLGLGSRFQISEGHARAKIVVPK